jgi:hypothetical protein
VTMVADDARSLLAYEWPWRGSCRVFASRFCHQPSLGLVPRHGLPGPREFCPAFVGEAMELAVIRH